MDEKKAGSNQSSPCAPKPVLKRRSNVVHDFSGSHLSFNAQSQNRDMNIVISKTTQSCSSRSLPVNCPLPLTDIDHSIAATSIQKPLINSNHFTKKSGFTRRMNPINKFASSMSNFKDHGMQIENLHPNIQPKRLNRTTMSKFPISHSAKNTSLSENKSPPYSEVDRRSTSQNYIHPSSSSANKLTSVGTGQQQRRNISSPLSTPSSRRLATVNLEGISCLTSNVPSTRTNSQKQERLSLFQLPASSIMPRVNQPVQNDITKEKSSGSSNHASTNQNKNAKSNASDCSGSKNLLDSFNAAAESDDTSNTAKLNE